MNVFISHHRPLPLWPGSRFPVVKYELLHRVLQQHADLFHIHPARPVGMEELSLVHDDRYIRAVVHGDLDPQAQRRIGFPWTPDMVDRVRHSVGGTLSAARAAWRDGVSGHLAGGTHHAHRSYGHGYCVFNDVAVSIRILQDEGKIRRATVIDLDVHHGDGTAELFADDPTVFTFSMHAANNFPPHKPPSNLDIALPDGTADAPYLDLLQQALDESIPWASTDMVFYIAGADPFALDRIGRLALTKSGLKQRDELVFDYCQHYRIPIVVVLGGGYGQDIAETVDIHAATFFTLAASPSV
ncbi:MAG: histone deacetylase [Pirellulaceae bacterium]|nr:MAG: histone deacetylase [Pirellulaceae bacterium]